MKTRPGWGTMSVEDLKLGGEGDEKNNPKSEHCNEARATKRTEVLSLKGKSVGPPVGPKVTFRGVTKNSDGHDLNTHLGE